MTYSVFDVNNKKDSSTTKLFFDDPVTIARYDKPKYSFLEGLTEKQLSFFWRPEEIDLVKDQRDFKNLSEHEQHIFTSNLKRQIILDSVQGRSPSIALLPIVSNPELEIWIQTWAWSETLHSKSYTHIIRNIYSDPSLVFDEIMNIEQVVDCAKDISKNYDTLINMNIRKEYGDYGADKKQFEYEHKQALWLALMSVNILEGVRFYVSFACSWAFAEIKKMEGNANIIKLIARDENCHLVGTQMLLKWLLEEDTDYVQIREKNKHIATDMFIQSCNQEKMWADYLFKDGSMIGLNRKLLIDYIEWITARRMAAVGLSSPYQKTNNPLPWTNKWISGSSVQPAPQETQITSYTVGQIKHDLSEEQLKDFEL